MAKTYTPIQRQTLTTNAASVTFSSIPSAYTDLVAVCSPIGTGDLQILMRFNSDTGTNYSVTIISGNGTSAESVRNSNATSMTTDYYFSVTTSGGMVIMNVMDYANTTTYKTALMRANNAAKATMANVGLWRNTAAVNAITLTASQNSFAPGSTFTLYGIKAA